MTRAIEILEDSAREDLPIRRGLATGGISEVVYAYLVKTEGQPIRREDLVALGLNFNSVKSTLARLKKRGYIEPVESVTGKDGYFKVKITGRPPPSYTSYTSYTSYNDKNDTARIPSTEVDNDNDYNGWLLYILKLHSGWYLGITSDYANRMRAHRRKYRDDYINTDVLFDGLTEQEANDLETSLVHQYTKERLGFKNKVKRYRDRSDWEIERYPDAVYRNFLKKDSHGESLDILEDLLPFPIDTEKKSRLGIEPSSREEVEMQARDFLRDIKIIFPDHTIFPTDPELGVGIRLGDRYLEWQEEATRGVMVNLEEILGEYPFLHYTFKEDSNYIIYSE